MTVTPVPRIVFDTNVTLSALLFSHGRLTWLVGHWQAGDCVPLVSRATAQELKKVLAYRKFQLSVDEQMEVLSNYLPLCEVAEIVRSCSLLRRDTKDQMFLDLAHCGHADMLVSGDDDLLVLMEQTRFVIESPERYRRRVRGADD